MAEPIDSSGDLKRQMEDLQAGVPPDDASPVPLAPRRGIPPWVKWMIMADVIIVAVVLVVIMMA